MATRVLSVFLLFASTIPMIFAETSGRLIDLTHSFSSETIYWPTGDEFTLRIDAEVIALPINIKGGSGAPLRIIAIIN